MLVENTEPEKLYVVAKEREGRVPTLWTEASKTQ